MKVYYADSSALVKRHIQETGTAWVKSVCANNLVITAEISMVEVYSALNRRLREGKIIQQYYKQISTDFISLCNKTYKIVRLSPYIIERTRLLLENYPLRAYDTVQLASALVSNESFLAENLSPLVFLSSDQRLLSVAGQERLLIDDPNYRNLERGNGAFM